jgi:hypothetical protein
MSKKRRRLNADAEVVKRKIAVGRFLLDGEVPKGSVPSDPSKQNPGLSRPPLYYTDRPFTCRDCGLEEVWTARQ